MLTPAGTLLIFDNGNHRASPFDGTVPLLNDETYSRAVEYAVDEENMEVRQAWEYEEDASPLLYAHFVGDGLEVRDRVRHPKASFAVLFKRSLGSEKFRSS